MATSKNAPLHRASTSHDGKGLSPQEEAVLRIKKGISGADDEVLERKTKDPELLARLLELERAIIKKAGMRKP